jgi:hypothetical protein
MELLPLVRRLWQRRLLMAAGALVAIAIAIAIGPPPPASSGLAWTRVALDTPDSQLLEPAPKGAETLPWRASLITHLLATDEQRGELARRLGVRPDQVAIADPVLDEPQMKDSMAQRASETAAVTVAPFVLTVSLKHSTLPMISVVAAAPDRAGARRLADAAVAVLGMQATGEGRYESAIPAGGGRTFQPFSVQAVDPVRAKTVTESQLPIKAVGGPVFLFGVWCAALAFLPRRGRRGARVAAQLG